MNIAIVGATGMVGSKFVEVLQERGIKADNFYLYASAKSAGKKINMFGKDYEVIELCKENILDKALELMLRAHEDEREEKMSAYNLGVINAKMKEYDQAIKYYEEEVTKKEFYPYAYYNLGILYKDIYKDYEKANDHCSHDGCHSKCKRTV